MEINVLIHSGLKVLLLVEESCILVWPQVQEVLPDIGRIRQVEG